MERHEIDRLEIEANGHTPPHILAQKKAKIVDRLIADEVADLFADHEPGQNPGTYYRDNLPYNTLK